MYLQQTKSDRALPSIDLSVEGCSVLSRGLSTDGAIMPGTGIATVGLVGIRMSEMINQEHFRSRISKIFQDYPSQMKLDAMTSFEVIVKARLVPNIPSCVATTRSKSTPKSLFWIWFMDFSKMGANTPAGGKRRGSIPLLRFTVLEGAVVIILMHGLSDV